MKSIVLTSEDLLTSRDETRAGFVAMALEKNAMAVPYIKEAVALRALASKCATPLALLDNKKLRKGLLAASGLSKKSLVHLDDSDKTKAIVGLIENFLEPSGESFVDELVYRFLLTSGDALGGKARNLAGMLGDRKFLRSVISLLSLEEIPYSWKDRKSNSWIKGEEHDPDTEKRIKALHWKRNGKNRILVMNVKLPVIDKNVDLVLINASENEIAGTDRSIYTQNSRFVALGELKGGIDPAGSDEHWKTANFALSRVRSSFQAQGLNPPTFFVGAAIQRSMADEIVRQLKTKVLNRAANLTSDDQLTSLCDWLINL